MKQQTMQHGWSPGLVREETRGRESEDHEWQILKEFGCFFSVPDEKPLEKGGCR